MVCDVVDHASSWFHPPPMILGGLDFFKFRIFWGDLKFEEESGGTLPFWGDLA